MTVTPDTFTPETLTPAALLDQVCASTRQRRLLEVAEGTLILHWADIHSGDDHAYRTTWTRPAQSMVQFGGEGTPPVQEHCLGELALARSIGIGATINALADFL